MLSLNTYNTIDGHVKNSSWTNDVEKPVNILKNCNHHFIFVLGCRPENKQTKPHISASASKKTKSFQPDFINFQPDDSLVFRMCARVDNSIHIQIQVVKLHLIRVGFSRIDRYPDSIALFRLKETQHANVDSSVSVDERKISNSGTTGA